LELSELECSLLQLADLAAFEAFLASAGILAGTGFLADAGFLAGCTLAAGFYSG